MRDEVTIGYQKEFRKSLKNQRFIKIDPSMPSNKYQKLTTDLPRRFASILSQLRTNHVPLQAYLHKFKLVDSPMCPYCGEAPETVTHFLIFCPEFALYRRQLRRRVGPRVHLDLSILGDSKRLPNLFRFIKASDRFELKYGDLDPTSIPQDPPE